MALEFQSTKPANDTQEQEDAPVEISFTLDESEFTCVLRTDGDAVLEWSELAAASENGGAVESPAGAAVVSRFFKLMMAPDQYAAFRAHMKQNHTSADTLIEIMQSINGEMESAVQENTERPTRQPLPSSSGRGVKDERTLKIISLNEDEEGEVEFAPPPVPRRQPQDYRKRQQQRHRAG